jgi:MFS transporter, FHS family, L-fucose permease
MRDHLLSTGAYFLWAPWAGFSMRKFGYKVRRLPPPAPQLLILFSFKFSQRGIYAGLSFYVLGALFYWPVAVKKSYPGFIICTFWISMGLSTLEVAANTYITVLGDPTKGAMRLTFSQAFVSRCCQLLLDDLRFTHTVERDRGVWSVGI